MQRRTDTPSKSGKTLLQRAREAVDEWDKTDEPADANPRESTIDDGGRSPDATGSLRAKLTQTELQRALRWAFIGLSKLMRSDATWTQSEFEEESRAIIDLLNRFPVLRVIMRLLGPISSLGGFLDKYEKLKAAQRPAPPKPQGADNVIRRWPWQKTKPQGPVVMGPMFEESAS